MAGLDRSAYAALRQEIAGLLEGEQRARRQAVEREKVQVYWEVGRRLARSVPEQRWTREGRPILRRLAGDLELRERRLYEMLQFFRYFPELPTPAILGWSHYRLLLKLADPEARSFYQEEASRSSWSVRRLEDQIQARRFESGRDAGARLPLPRRGRLYTYRLVPAARRPRLDLGFGIRHAASFAGLEERQPGQIVEVSRAGSWYRLRPSTAGREALYTYSAVVERVVDGDTLWAQIDCGFQIWVRQKLRLRGIDAPELSRREGRQVREQVEERLSRAEQVVLSTHRPDKYGRYLADLFYLEGSAPLRRVLREGRFLNGELVEEGAAVEY